MVQNCVIYSHTLMQVKKETKLWPILWPTNATFLQPLCHNHHIEKGAHSGSTSLVERWGSLYYYWLFYATSEYCDRCLLAMWKWVEGPQSWQKHRIPYVSLLFMIYYWKQSIFDFINYLCWKFGCKKINRILSTLTLCLFA